MRKGSTWSIHICRHTGHSGLASEGQPSPQKWQLSSLLQPGDATLTQTWNVLAAGEALSLFPGTQWLGVWVPSESFGGLP